MTSPTRRDIFGAFLSETIGRGRAYWWRPRGASMAPTINDRDRVLIAPAAPGRLRVGDIVKFTSAGEMRLHRLIRRRRLADGAWEFTCRGDNAIETDPAMTERDVIGVAVAVERDGCVRRLGTWRARWAARLEILRRTMRERTWIVMLVAMLAGALALNAGVASAGRPGPAPLSPLDVLGDVGVGRHPVGVAIDTSRGRAVVANRNDGTVSIVDLIGRTRLADIRVGRSPVGVAVNSDTHVAAVTLAGQRAVALVDVDALALIGKIPVARRPGGVAIHPGRNVAVVANEKAHSVSIIDLGRAEVVAEIAVGRRPSAVAVNPLTHVAAIANQGDGTITLLDIDLPTSPALVGMLVLPRSRYHHDDDPRGRQHDGRNARPVALDFDAAAGVNRLVVADLAGQAVHVLTLDAASALTGLRSLPLGRKPFAVATKRGFDFALVTTDQDEAFALRLATPALTARAGVGRHPRGVAIDPNSCLAVVSNENGRRGGGHRGRPSHPGRVGTVSVIDSLPCTPVVTALSPDAIEAQSGDFSLTILGSGFGPNTTVNFGSQIGLVPFSITAGAVTVALTAPATAGTLDVSVTSFGATSNTVPFRVTPPGVVPLQLTAIAPNRALAEGQALDLTLTGRKFAPNARVFVNGVELTQRPPASPPDTPTTLFRRIPEFPDSSLTLGGGSLPVQVVNPGPPDETSNVRTLELRNPTPIIDGILPNSAVAGTSDTVVFVNGSGFVAQRDGTTITSLTQVFFNGVPVPTVPVESSPTQQLEVTISAALLAVPGTARMEAVNPGPCGLTSSSCIAVAEPFRVLEPNLDPRITLSTFEFTDGAPTDVALYHSGAALIAAATSPPDGTLRRLDVTDLLTPVLAGVPIPVTAGGALGDLAVTNGGAPKLVTTLPFDVTTDASDNRMAIVDPAGTTTYVTVGRGPTGVAVGGTTAVVTNVDDLTLSIVDVTTGLQTGQVTLGQGDDPTAADYVEFPPRVAINAAGTTAAVIDQPFDRPGMLIMVDLVTRTVTRRITVGNNPSAVAFNSTTGRVLVANQDDNDLWVINPTAPGNPVVGQFPVGQSPSGIALDPAANRALVASFLDNLITAIDLATGATTSYQLGLGAPLDIAWDPVAQVVVTSSLVNNNLLVIGLPTAVLP